MRCTGIIYKFLDIPLTLIPIQFCAALESMSSFKIWQSIGNCPNPGEWNIKTLHEQILH